MSDYNFKEFMSRPDRLTPGHRMCAGCGATIALRNVMKAIKPEDHAVICKLHPQRIRERSSYLRRRGSSL